MLGFGDGESLISCIGNDGIQKNRSTSSIRIEIASIYTKDCVAALLMMASFFWLCIVASVATPGICSLTPPLPTGLYKICYLSDVYLARYTREYTKQELMKCSLLHLTDSQIQKK